MNKEIEKKQRPAIKVSIETWKLLNSLKNHSDSFDDIINKLLAERKKNG